MRRGPAIPRAPVQVEPTDAEVADCALRLLGLMERPAALPVLRAQLVREMHYWLLVGRHDAAIRQLGWPGSHAPRIARAVTLLRAEFAQSLPVERLAAVARMSPSSFYEHFRAATSLSPLQFQKQLRLIEARRLMTVEGLSASTAAFAVGYESAQQFTREYRRMFGLPPGKDVGEVRRPVVTAALAGSRVFGARWRKRSYSVRGRRHNSTDQPQQQPFCWIGGHFTEPKEQKTQQSPALGRSNVLQRLHS